MKKWVGLMCLSCLLVLGACANTDTNQLTIPELTDREKQILGTTSNQAFVFDYTADQKYKDVSIWLEKYEKGKKTAEPVSQFSTSLPGKLTSGGIVFTVVHTADQQVLFFTNVGDTDGFSGIQTQDTMPNGENLAMLWGTNPQESLPLSEEMLLASIIHTSTTEGVGTSSLSVDFYEQKEGYLEELKAKEYDVVYLLKASFKK
ncbi:MULTISPECIES: hypothetical protein [Sporosarcina]|uniref:Lipoprotein n=2 Tax=Sporosarcina newyorkensis TaxID=759851 RepID=A0A1T4YAM8_9BACL|nr:MULTISPECIES: hypothetical protein [Sporosarcina]EGQ26275.1 cytochrome c551 [Sporosarcina newyorkensis 2681]MBY0223672.1 hypothetical protein [Sporosarcina aquimarina]SKA98829.1 hypothetical protein SAMN04244570_2193 [Sporosarcina newyorkensis]